MNPQALNLLTTKQARPNGFWLPYAWMVRLLVEEGYQTIVAVRKVLDDAGLPFSDLASLRVVYHRIKKKEWPAGLREALRPAPVEAEEGAHTTVAEEESYIDDALRAELEAEGFQV